MLTRDADAFLGFARHCKTDFGPATARAAFLVSPEGFQRAEQSAQDNRYMAAAERFDTVAALAEHRQLQAALAQDVPVIAFAGNPATPDAVFPNNVFATTPGQLIVGRMRHPVRQREAERPDIRRYFTDVMGYAERDLSGQPHPCELTGSLVIDRARGLGFCGLSERCDEAGAALMHEAFGLRATLMFPLAPGEYHTNVLLAVLAGRAALICPAGFADPRIPGVIAELYGDLAVTLNVNEQAAFAGNAIALSERRVWMSEAASTALTAGHRRQLQEGAGFAVGCVPLAALEHGGGSLRCCVAEIF
ncbi:MAG TPA: arginine deiminase-related protein [Pseudoxanthomonas sp.]|nr:arginine deiminase-related protein [Pseudoxanthomonas sp.]